MNSRVRALYRIDARPDGPARARGLVRSECSARVPGRTLEKLQLLVSELVTSGIVHGRDSRSDSIMLDLGLNSTLTFAVIGPGGFDTGAAGARDDGWGLRDDGWGLRDDGWGLRDDGWGLRDDGWGLRLVERLADRWGIQRTPEGTRVWFETESG